jgi:O-acetyl-ADP-ribose deacetylase (regulator of RNase III)
MSLAVAPSKEMTIRDKVVRLVREDITELEVDAFVYYAQPDLALGSGFGGAIGVRGGASIQKELNEIVAEGPIPDGEAVASEAGKLKANFILHAVGPRFREDGIEEKLLTTMRNTLRLAEEKGAKSLAFPAMGAGYYGIPAPVSAQVMLQALKEHLNGETQIKEVVISLFDRPQFQAFESALAAFS